MWAHAGTPGPAAVEGLDAAEYEKAMALNVTSAVFAAGEVVQHMRRRGGGALVFTASVSGLVGSMFSPVYSAGKFAVVGLTKSLAQRFAADRVRVNVVCPGPIDTPMLPGFIGRSDDKQQIAENQKKLMAAVPLGRIGAAGGSRRTPSCGLRRTTPPMSRASACPSMAATSRDSPSAGPDTLSAPTHTIRARANQAPLNPSAITS